MLAWFAAKGIKVAPFKVGPDFIDPGLHTKISGSVSFNLDSWMLSASYNRNLFAAKSQGREIAVVEGVMGLFDGYDALSETGSTAQMAKLLNLPVVLVVSAKGKARSAAAIVKGFETFDPDLKFAGVIFAQAGSERHYHYLRDAVEQNCKTPCLGYLPKNEKIVMPERHLGLVTADEMPISDDTMSILVSMVDEHLDMDRLIKSLPEFSVPEAPALDPLETKENSISVRTSPDRTSPGKTSDSPRIAVARDKAFCFYYQDNLDILKEAGADIVYFSPLEDNSLPEDIDGIYFGGGYPELNAGQLKEKKELLAQVKQASLSGMPIYGECGGFMYLCRNLSDMDGRQAGEMCGIFDFDIQMSRRLRSLGYREITLTSDTLLGKKGEKIRGHEFHYSSIASDQYPNTENPEDVYEVASRVGQDISLKGYQSEQTLGSYLHVHFGSNPKAASHLVNCCSKFRRARLEKSGN